MKKAATAYLRRDKLLLWSSSKTVVGVWIAVDPLVVVDSIDDDEAVAESLARVLESSEQGVPHPTNFDELFKPMLDLTGTRSWREFAKGTKCCEILQDGDEIVITPTKNRGRDGFGHLPEKDVVMSNSEIGGASRYLVEGFSRCEV